MKILHQSKKTKHIYSHDRPMQKGYDFYSLEKSLCGKGIRGARVTDGGVLRVTCKKCLETYRKAVSND